MWSRKWSIEEQAKFLKLVGELLERGYPLAEAIASLAFQFKQRRQADLNFIVDHLKEGFSLSHILEILEFNEELIGYVFFAERHGGFIEALQEGSEVILKRRHDLDRLLKIIYYPIMLIGFTILLFGIVEKVLLPRFTSLFTTLQVDENFFTKLLLIVGNLMPILFLLILLLILVIGSYYVLYFRTYDPIRKKQLIIKIPLLGKMFRLFYTQYFSAQLSYLLLGGLSINDALGLFVKNDNQPFYKQVGEEVNRELIGGEKLEVILKGFHFFEEDLGRVVTHGQNNGRLDKELFFYSRHCLERLEEMTEKWLKIIQPVLFLFIGILIVSMYLAILLPMFKLLDGF